MKSLGSFLVWAVLLPMASAALVTLAGLYFLGGAR